MPDFERILDDLDLHLSSDKEDRAWRAGYIAGKTKARREIIRALLTMALIAFAIMVIAIVL